MLVVVVSTWTVNSMYLACVNYDRAPSLPLFPYLSIGVLKAVENVNKVIGPALIAKVILIAHMCTCWMISKVVCCFLLRLAP